MANPNYRTPDATLDGNYAANTKPHQGCSRLVLRGSDTTLPGNHLAFRKVPNTLLISVLWTHLRSAVDELFRSLNPNFRLQPSDKAARLLNASDIEVQECWLEVAFALLRDSRESFDKDRWGRFKSKIQQVVGLFPLYDDRFYYEQALWLLWNLQHDQARSLIENWTPSQNSPLAKMWKAGILIELDDQEGARTILQGSPSRSTPTIPPATQPQYHATFT